MLPAWSRKLIPLVFIILYGLVRLFLEKPAVWIQGADMSLRTTYPRRISNSKSARDHGLWRLGAYIHKPLLLGRLWLLRTSSRSSIVAASLLGLLG
jgi:hypothetical protein